MMRGMVVVAERRLVESNPFAGAQKSVALKLSSQNAPTCSERGEKTTLAAGVPSEHLVRKGARSLDASPIAASRPRCVRKRHRRRLLGGLDPTHAYCPSNPHTSDTGTPPPCLCWLLQFGRNGERCTSFPRVCLCHDECPPEERRRWLRMHLTAAGTWDSHAPSRSNAMAPA